MNLHILSTSNVDILLDSIRKVGLDYGLDITATAGPYNQVEQQVFDNNSPLWKNKPEVIWVAMQLYDVYPTETLFALSDVEIHDIFIKWIERVVNIVHHIRSITKAIVIVSNNGYHDLYNWDIYHLSRSNTINKENDIYNCSLCDRLKSEVNTYVLDQEGIMSYIGKKRWHDMRYRSWGRLYCSPEVCDDFSKEVCRFIRGIVSPRVKVIATDLDNTLWKGVVGDDGAHDICMGDEYPGNLYRRLQKFLLVCKHRGVVLVIVSKNDIETIYDAFEHHDMLLKKDDFVSIKASWYEKYLSIQEASNEINVGSDSFVFIDDNPIERAKMCSSCPSVVTPSLSENPDQWVDYLLSTGIIDFPEVTHEDTIRTSMYISDRKRTALLNESGDIVSYLHSLGMVVDIRPVEINDIKRVLQLFQRTNQFNLTTIRYHEDELIDMMSSDTHILLCIALKDIYGELGIISSAVLHKSVNKVIIESFVMSCRVMGRHIEDAVMSYIVNWCENQNVGILLGNYVKTPKNTPVANFYSQYGFTCIQSANEVLQYSLDPIRMLKWPEFIRMEK